MIKTTLKQIDKMKNAINSKGWEENEKIWTLLIANILSNSRFKDYYLKKFCDYTILLAQDYDIWFESQPLSPRKDKYGHSEKNTHLDLAFGNIKKRGSSRSGIEYDLDNNNSWVCFVEAKFNSDIELQTEYDSNRDQIIRVIDNLLCFQGQHQFPKKLFFTMLLPREHQNNPYKYYNKKLEEYKDQTNILRDLNTAVIRKRNDVNWKYPENIKNRIKLLKIKKVYYEDILEKEYNMNNLNLLDLSDWQKIFYSEILNKIIDSL